VLVSKHVVTFKFFHFLKLVLLIMSTCDVSVVFVSVLHRS
jgi:hypothetical protein